MTLFTNELRFELLSVDKKIRMGQIMAKVSNRKFSILILLVIVISPSLLPTLGFTSMHLVLKDKQNFSGTQVGECGTFKFLSVEEKDEVRLPTMITNLFAAHFLDGI